MNTRSALLAFALFFSLTCVRAQITDSLNGKQEETLFTNEQDTLAQADSTPVRLRRDDPVYNPRYPAYIPAGRVLGATVVNWAIAKYVYKFDWPSSGPKDWKANIKAGPHWDSDRFGINFIGHPHTGNYYFNIARSNGYSYWGSLPFTLEGSLIWEYMGENERPSYNDMINTTLSGAFLGEVFYRLSSNILDDRTRGGQRVFRELLAGIVNPPRAFNRLTQGKMFRVTPKEVYQKEPLYISLSAGIHKVNNRENQDNHFGTGATNGMLNIQFDYGDPFEVRKRKPFDIFRFRIELSYGADSNLLDNVIGHGLLAGKTINNGRMLIGLFQHFDYWRNNIFEIGTLGFGGGLIHKAPVSKSSDLISVLHLAVVPLAGNNTQFGPDTSEFRKYNFGGGFQGKWDETLQWNRWVSIGFTSYYYWIHTYNGLPGNSFIAIMKPTITVRLINNIRVGFEHHIYYNRRFLNEIPLLNLTRTEQKLFLQWNLE